MSILPKKFYQRDTVIVAKELLGKKLTRKIGNYEISGIISETEAYRHKDDPASHAFRSITSRNKVMFGEVGIAYVYFTYGMHYCFNIVAKKLKIPAGAVLIRGINPEKGIKKMEKNRNIKNKRYKFFRLDTFFSDTKYQNVKIVNDGGWHFSNLKNIDDSSLLFDKLKPNSYKSIDILKDGKSAINAFLDDYATVIKAATNLYQVTLDESYLQFARLLNCTTIINNQFA